MISNRESDARKAFVWIFAITAVCVPLAFSAFSPQLAWRGPVYITACFAGVIGLGLMLFQPLLAGGFLPGLNQLRSRRAHRLIGTFLVFAVVVHIVGLWLTSPPDVIDVFLFRSPTPFSVWGVVAMWALFITALLAALRRRLHLRPIHWSLMHRLLVVVIVIGTVVHALLIEGVMETASKAILCLLVLALGLWVIFGAKFWSDLRIWSRRRL